jgi:hypothetical protein
MSRKPKPRRDAPPTVPDDASITGSRRKSDSDKEQDARLETYEQEVERASVESLAEHPEGSAPPLERLVDAHPEKQRK